MMARPVSSALPAPVTPTVLTGALIDCDGTLVDTEPLWTIAERETLARWGATSSAEFERALVGKSPRACAAFIAAYVGAATHEIEEIHRDLEAAYDRVLETAPIHARPGARRLVHELLARAVPVVVVSNSVERHVEHALVKGGLSELASSLQSPSPEIGAKPAPDLYIAACARCSINPSLAVAIEDTRVGIDAARGAGLFTVGVPSVAGERLEADHVVRSLEEIDVAQLEELVVGRRLR
jgi:HAD superfamily hydrolase (TIGR01509 family)